MLRHISQGRGGAARRSENSLLAFRFLGHFYSVGSQAQFLDVNVAMEVRH